MQHNSPVLTGRRVAVFIGLLLAGACSGSPSSPTRVAAAPALKSVRYVRTQPVVNPDQTLVSLLVVHPSASCFGCQGSSGSDWTYVSLTQTGPDTFEYPFASSVLDNIPPDTAVSIEVDDQAVSTVNTQPQDIYVNGTKVSNGVFRERSDGTIY
jgi:hypothetical protein